MPDRSWLKYQESPIAGAQAQNPATVQAITQCLLTALVLGLRHIRSETSCIKQKPQLIQAGQALLPRLCQLVASLGNMASLAAMATSVVLRACHLEPVDWVPTVAQHLHIVQALAQAYHRQSITVVLQQQLSSQQHLQPELASGSISQQPNSQQLSSSDAGLGETEETVEGALLLLAVHVAQSTAGAHLLLDQGVSDLLPQLAKWLLSPDGGGTSCA